MQEIIFFLSYAYFILEKTKYFWNTATLWLRYYPVTLLTNHANVSSWKLKPNESPFYSMSNYNGSIFYTSCPRKTLGRIKHYLLNTCHTESTKPICACEMYFFLFVSYNNNHLVLLRYRLMTLMLREHIYTYSSVDSSTVPYYLKRRFLLWYKW